MLPGFSLAMGCTLLYLTVIVLLPLGVLFFSSVSLVGPLANALAIPVVSGLVTPLALVGAFGALGWPSAGGAAGEGVRIARFAADGLAAPFSWAVTSGECPVSLVSFPIDCAGQESGALLLCSCECGAFEPQELDMLGKVADHLRNGIETIRTRSERDQALEDLRFRLGLEAILSSAIRAFFNLTGTSVDAPVQAAWARISEFLGIDHGYYVLFELSLIHISEPTRLLSNSYAVF